METKTPVEENPIQSTMDPIASNVDDEATKREENDLSVAGISLNDGSLNCDKIEKIEEKKLTIEDLPIEMLEAIFRNLTSSDLVNCRPMNSKWNEIATHIVGQRADIQIVFSFIDGELTQNLERRPRQTLLADFWPLVNTSESSLTFSDLVECLKLSINCPLRSFRFKDVVKSAEVEGFLTLWGKNIFVLGVKIEEDDDVETLRLFLDKTPNLQQLDIDFGFLDKQTIKSTAHLFAVGSNQFQLPQLKTLCVKGSYGNYDYFSVVIADILKVASNLNCFEHRYRDGALKYTFQNDLIMLQSLNKLNCLKGMNLLLVKDLIELLEQSPQIMDLQLTSLNLEILNDDDTLSARATTIINRIFDSSKNSLMELKITPLGTLSGLVIPKFANLRKLSLSHDGDPGLSMFPQHFNMADHFPNLLELSAAALLTEDNLFSTHQPLQVMPSVQLLRLFLQTESDKMNKMFMKLTPNVKTLLVVGTHNQPPTINFKAIAKHLKTLKNLGWHLYGKSLKDLQSKCVLDSLITGISEKNCKQLSAKFRRHMFLSPQNVATTMKTYRKKGSIVDVRGLRRFDISIFETRNLCSRDNFEHECSCVSDTSSDSKYEIRDVAGFRHDNYFYKKCFTKVSTFLAFERMPNLTVNIMSRCVR